MAITYACILPYAPLLAPSLTTDSVDTKIPKTISAYRKIAADLYSLQPDTLIIISAHNEMLKDSFTILQHTTVRADLGLFGDFKTSQEWNIDMGLVANLKGSLETIIPITLIDTPVLHYSAAIPLLKLGKPVNNFKIVHMGISGQCPEDHVRCGIALHELLNESSKRYAIIIAAELSHKKDISFLSRFLGKKEDDMSRYDNAILTSLRDNDLSQIISLQQYTESEASQKSYKQLLMLYGILAEMKYSISILAYETSLGTGYVTCSIRL